MKKAINWESEVVWGIGFFVSMMILMAGTFSAIYFGLKHIINIVGG